MPSKNMIPKGKRRQTVKPLYRELRTAEPEAPKQEVDAHLDATHFDTADFEDEAPDPLSIAIHSEPGRRNALPTTTEPRYKSRYSQPKDAPLAEVPALTASGTLAELVAESGVRRFSADASAKGRRLDKYLAEALPEISRSRMQGLIEAGKVSVNGKAAKASLKLDGGEALELAGEPTAPPMRAAPENIPLTIIYEDDDLAVIDKPAGMVVHPGAGEASQHGTLVNALLFHFGANLSSLGVDGEVLDSESESDDSEQEPAEVEEPATSNPMGVQTAALRPGIVHRLDKETSGLILVAKNDRAHRRLAEMFAARSLRKVYIALVHGNIKGESGTVKLPIARDIKNRTRMTTRRGVDGGARSAVSNWRVLERIPAVPSHTAPFGPFTLVEVHIETGRTHQIRVHLAALGHPIAGDTLYGAPKRLRPAGAKNDAAGEPTLTRNFLHAAELDLDHPITRKALELRSGLPEELEAFLGHVRVQSS